MAEAKRKSRKAGEAANLVIVDANRLREALKHTFEGVTMLFDCIGLNVPVGEPIPEQEEKPAESNPAEESEFIPVEEPPEEAPIVEAPADETTVEKPPAMETPEEKKQDEPPAETSPVVSTVTQDDITKIIVRKIKQDRSNNEKIGAILKTYGVAKVSDLPALKFEAFLTDISQI